MHSLCKARVILICLVVPLFVFCSTAVGAAAKGAMPTASVISVLHPSRVSPNETFSVTLVANYSDKFLVDVGIWDSAAGEMINSVTLISSFTGPGLANFSFQLTAPNSTTEWHLVAVTRVWWQDAWYQDQKGGTKPFDVIVSSNVTVALNSTVDGAIIYLDGAAYRPSNSSVSIVLRAGTYSLAADQIIPSITGVRFMFTGWSDGVNSNPRQLVVSKDTNIEAVYRTEYILNVSSDYGMTFGAGWYPQDSDATFGVVPTYMTSGWSGYLTQNYRFSDWSAGNETTYEVASIRMDSPKSVHANWVRSGSSISLTLIAAILLLCSVPLGIRLAYLSSRRRLHSIRTATHRCRMYSKILVLLLLVSCTAAFTPQVHAVSTVEPKASVVRIGNADWYYWNETQTDTCLIWLGGGLSPQTTLPSGTFLINSFDYESFGTIHFIQDLAQFYCVIALAKGSLPSYNPTANRTIYQEPYQIQSTILSQIHQWIRNQSYQHTFLVGYSVGAQAAAIEVTLRSPQEWSSADGLIMITVPIDISSIQHASQIQTNLMLLYGGNLPDYEATGKQYYENAPSEGWHGSHYLHKELYVLPDVGHEVWTVRDTGAYTPKALNLVVRFIERSKGFQYYPQNASVTAYQTNNSEAHNGTITITSLQGPSKIVPGKVFSIEAHLNYNLTTPSEVVVIAFDPTGAPISASLTRLTGAGNAVSKLLVTSLSNTYSNSTEPALGNFFPSAIVLLKQNGTLTPIGRPINDSLTITNLLTLTVKTTLPGLSILIDGEQYPSSLNGGIQINVAKGVHTIQVTQVVYGNNGTRWVFTEWEDSTTYPIRPLALSGDMAVTAFYRVQYFLNVTSPLGSTTGTGWYDANSTTEIQITPPFMPSQGTAFDHWTGATSETSPRAVVIVNQSRAAEAVWVSIGTGIEAQDTFTILLVALGVIVFSTLLFWNLAGTRLIRKR